MVWVPPCPTGTYGLHCEYSITVQNMDALLKQRIITQDQYDRYRATLTSSDEWQRGHIQASTAKPLSMETMVMALVAVKLSKTPEGLKLLRELGKEFIKGIFDTLHALGQASAANQVTAWANPYLVMMILERFGFVAGKSVGEFKLGLSIITGATVAEGYLDTIQGFFPFSSPEPSEFPASIVYSARTEGGQVTEEVKAKAVTPKDIEQLRKLLGQK